MEEIFVLLHRPETHRHDGLIVEVVVDRYSMI